MKKCEYQQIDPRTLQTPTPIPPPHLGAQRAEREEPKGPRRKWQVFPGKNRFYCDGRIIVARQSGVLPLTLGLILITSGLFFIYDCPFLVKHLTSCIPVIGGGLFVFVVITLLQTSLTDPGILPRATPDEAADIEKQIGKDQLSHKWAQHSTIASIAQSGVPFVLELFMCRVLKEM
ncbi:putative palmitoyltransferase ZDHHC14 [Liparis tanakae]|uniref:Putative palmitoyltransferase ZDHHC14 n=1 Tax=Liparis tanakae TaxID=230148 RepID=A0A4Z2J9J0_9TELE|nr:putative palmitoyltransferase ZDHHC14 [Liparis tanakae]